MKGEERRCRSSIELEDKRGGKQVTRWDYRPLQTGRIQQRIFKPLLLCERLLLLLYLCSFCTCTSMAKIICGIHCRIGCKASKVSNVNDIAGFLIFNLSYRVHLFCCQEKKLKTSFVYLINRQEIQFRSICRRRQQRKLEVQFSVRLIELCQRIQLCRKLQFDSFYFLFESQNSRCSDSLFRSFMQQFSCTKS